jgi:hypothetical protein
VINSLFFYDLIVSSNLANNQEKNQQPKKYIMKITQSIKTLLPLVAFAGLTLAGSANAGVIYFDDFDGSSGDDLHGTTPDIGANNWVAASNYKADGSSTALNQSTMSLAFAPTNGLVYTLDAQIATVGGTQWVQFGYGGAQPTTGVNWTTGPWSLLRAAGSEASRHYAIPGNGTGGLVPWTTLDTLTYANDMDVRIVLDTTGGTDNWMATWYAKAGNVGTYSEVRGATLLTGTGDDITSVGFSTYNSGNNTVQFNSFSLSDNTVAAIPEPSSTALLGLGGLAIILRRRK